MPAYIKIVLGVLIAVAILQQAQIHWLRNELKKSINGTVEMGKALTGAVTSNMEALKTLAGIR